MTSKPPIKWSTAKDRLARLNKYELIDLLRDLYHVSPQNQQFFRNALSKESDAARAFERSRDGVIDPFYEDDDVTEVHLAKSVNALNRYRDVYSEDTDGIADLMLILLEEGILSGVQRETGGDDAYLSILERVLEELVGLLKTVKGQIAYEEHGRERLLALAKRVPEISGDFQEFFDRQVSVLGCGP